MTNSYPLSPGDLSVRTDATGGSVLSQVAGSVGAYGSQLVSLFHGYNDSLACARDAYAAFFKRFPAPGNALYDKWKPIMHRCYWPGDKAWGKFSFLSYTLEIKPAKDTAAVFANFIANLPIPAGVLDIYFIAHSLGNRVVLELLESLKAIAPAGIRFAGFCMMAAAVPVSMAQPNGSLFSAATLSSTRRALYSRADTVLHFAFPIGETAALEGFFPTAIGRFGQPPSDWTAETEMFISANHGYNHPDYWCQPNTIPQISAFLGIPTSAAPPSTSIVQRTLPSPASLPQNQLPSGSLPKRSGLG